MIIWWIITFVINWFVFFYESFSLWNDNEISHTLVLSNQRSKIQRYSLYNEIKTQKRTKSSHLRSWNQRIFDIFVWLNNCNDKLLQSEFSFAWLTNNQLIVSQDFWKHSTPPRCVFSCTNLKRRTCPNSSPLLFSTLCLFSQKHSLAPPTKVQHKQWDYICLQSCSGKCF